MNSLTRQILIGVLTCVLLYVAYRNISKMQGKASQHIFKGLAPTESSNTSVKKSKSLGPLDGYNGDSDNMELNNQDDARIDLGPCANSGQFISSNLLPKEDPNMDDSLNFVPTIEGQNFVDARKYNPLQPTRNANLQLRSDPVTPQDVVSPWMQSTITPDARRKPLEIG